MKVTTSSHKKGADRISAPLLNRLRSALETLPVGIQNTRQLRREILRKLRDTGWSGATRVDARSKISITAMNGGVALCLQTGNMGRFYADLLKLQCLFKKKTANAAVFVVLGTSEAKRFGSNLVNFDRLVTELRIFKSIISIPIYVIGIDGDTP